MLWPGTDLADDDENRRARARLKTEINKARDALGGHRQRLRVSPGANDFVSLELEKGTLDVDVDVERAARSARDFRTALALHRGSLLQAWSDPWIEHYRKLQQSAIQTSLVALHEVEEIVLPSAVSRVLKHGGAAWLQDADANIATLRNEARRSADVIRNALRAMQPDHPVVKTSIAESGTSLALRFGEDHGEPNRDTAFEIDDSALGNEIAASSPREILASAIGAKQANAETFTSSTAVAASGMVQTRRSTEVLQVLRDGRNVVLVGASAAGKTIGARQCGARLIREGWTVTYFDVGASGAALADLGMAFISLGCGPANRHLTILDNLQGNPGLASSAIRLASTVPGAQILALCWPSAKSIARQHLSNSPVISWTGHDVVPEIASAVLTDPTDAQLHGIAQLAKGDLTIAGLALDYVRTAGSLPTSHELTETAFEALVRGANLSADATVLLHEISALGQFEIEPTQGYVEGHGITAARELVASGAVRVDQGHCVVGHRTIATLTAAYIADRRPELPAPIKLAVEYLSAAADEQVLAVLQRLDTAQLQASSSADQHGSAYLARAWNSARVLSRYVALQSQHDPTWGDNTASAIFAAETLARFDRERWTDVASYVRRRWDLRDGLPTPVGAPPNERVDFDEIAKRMADEDRFGIHPISPESADAVDLDRMHRTWVLGLLMGFEASAPEPHSARRDALVAAAANAIEPEGNFYPSRVPWVTARVLLGLAALGESRDNSAPVREACDWLLRPHPEGPCRFGVWESGTGTWNTSIMTTTMCLMALVRCGVPATHPTILAGVAFVEREGASWRAPGKEIDAADALEMHLLTGGHWSTAKRELTQLLDWARDRNAWATATQPASISQDESSKVPALASSLVRVVWEILRSEMPVLLEGVAMDFARQLNAEHRR